MESIPIKSKSAKSKPALKKPSGILLKQKPLLKAAAIPKQAAKVITPSETDVPLKKTPVSKSVKGLKKGDSTDIPLKKIPAAKELSPKVATSEFRKILNKLRSKADKAPTMEDITAEVEMIRNKRYGTKR